MGKNAYYYICYSHYIKGAYFKVYIVCSKYLCSPSNTKANLRVLFGNDFFFIVMKLVKQLSGKIHGPF